MKKLQLVQTAPCCTPGAPLLPTEERERLAGQFKALSDPTRLAIVNQLASAEECCVCNLEPLGLSQPTISHHLKILREAGLVESTRRGTWAYYRLVPEAVQSLAFALAGGDQHDSGQGRDDADALETVHSL
jgi:ArsR family transcriptional regulator, arsenate/arsenite/antimonite-responsive transcriptional repressor